MMAQDLKLLCSSTVFSPSVDYVRGVQGERMGMAAEGGWQKKGFWHKHIHLRPSLIILFHEFWEAHFA